MRYLLVIFLIFKSCFSQFNYNNDAQLKELTKFNREMRNCQNHHRYIHGSPDLVVNPELLLKAQDEANRLAKIGRLDYGNVFFKGVKVGETLWGKSAKSGDIGIL
jgi:hypothetical protein